MVKNLDAVVSQWIAQAFVIAPEFFLGIRAGDLRQSAPLPFNSFSQSLAVSALSNRFASDGQGRA